MVSIERHDAAPRATASARHSIVPAPESLRTIRGVSFIRVRGTIPERARAHAALLRERVRAGAIPALAKKNEWLIRRSPGPTQWPPLQALTMWLYRKALIPYLGRRNPPELRELVRAMSEESGLPEEAFIKSIFQADVFMLMCRVSVMKHLLGRGFGAGGLPGCTSAVTLKDWNRGGRLLACRNQDYPMVGPWEGNTTVVFSEPSERDQIPHVGITTAGVHTAGLTSINREGLTLFTHAHFGRNVSLHGMPVTDIGDEIIRRARSLGEAVDIARSCRSHANWSFVVSSARENSAVVIEMTPAKTSVRGPEDGYLAHTNYFHDEELRKDEARISGAYAEDLEARFCRIRELLEPHRGSVEPARMTAALGDRVDPFTLEERVVGNTVGVATTIKSAVFDPLAQKFWVSCRQEAPTGLGDFLEVDVDRFWEQAYEPARERQWPSLPGYRPRDPSLVDGIRHHREAYRAFHMDNHLPDYKERALEELREAVRVFAKDGNLWVQLGILAFSLERFDEAEDALNVARTMRFTRHVEGVRDLFIARCLDIRGQRSEAVALYQKGAEARDPLLREAMRSGLKRAYRAKQASSLMVDLQFPDAFHY